MVPHGSGQLEWTVDRWNTEHLQGYFWAVEPCGSTAVLWLKHVLKSKNIMSQELRVDVIIQIFSGKLINKSKI